MRLFALAFLCGVLLLQPFTFLPASYWIVVAVFCILLIEIFCIKKYKPLRYLSALVFGFAWTLFYVHMLFSWNLSHEMEGKPLRINGYIASIPNAENYQTSFVFSVKNIQSTHVQTKIKLSTRDENLKNLRAGEKWQFVVRLKRIHGMMNPGGFDYESRALEEGVRATGYIVKSPDNILLENHWYHYFPDRIRERLKDKIEANLPVTNTSPWIVALALGERQNISAENWEVLRNTGTNHLMAIAGLHIGCMAGVIFFLASWFWRRFPRLMLFAPAQLAGGFFALVMGVFYATLAGFSIPAERTCIMLSVVMLALIMKKEIVSWHTWSLALLIVLLVNPLSVLTESFWLSFGAVALIVYGVSGRLNQKSIWWKLGRVQWVIFIGLIPAGIWLFQQVSLIAFIANSIAIPCVAFIIVPLVLLGSLVLIFSAKLGGLILVFADKLLAILWKVLTYLSHLSWANYYVMIPDKWVLAGACVGIVIFLLPTGFKGKWLSIFWFLPLIFYHYPKPQAGEVWFSLLDVGQGLSTVIQTQHHVLVFDAGPKFGPNYDMGESVVAPFLRSIGIKKIDMLVISHPDNDHIGGAKSLFHYFKILKTKTSTPDELLPFPSEYCLRGDAWQWDDVTFQFLYPTPDNLNLDNDSSCVLSITNKSHKTVLLTGDIEKFAEHDLLQNEKNNLAADILVAPHHGSKTSAVNEFVESVHPRYVLFPVGYRNRYRFPHVSVIEKYRLIHSDFFATDVSGAIQFVLAETASEPKQYRMLNEHYWNVQ